MIRYQVRLFPDLVAFVRRLHPQLKGKIRAALEELEIDPHLGKPLKDSLKGLFSYRVSHYRIIYQIKQKQILIEVIEIAERKTVYDNVLSLLARARRG